MRVWRTTVPKNCQGLGGGPGKDDTANIVTTSIENDTSSSEITEEGPGMDVKEAKRLVSPGEITELHSYCWFDGCHVLLKTVLIGTQTVSYTHLTLPTICSV